MNLFPILPDKNIKPKPSMSPTPKIILISIFFILFTNVINAQAWNWGKKISVPNGAEITYSSSTIDHQGNIIVLSGLDSLHGPPNSPLLNTFFLLTKYDYKGIKLWERTMKDNSIPYIYRVVVDSAGSIYILTDRYIWIPLELTGS